MSVKTAEIFTCDECKHVIAIGRGGVHFSCIGGERVIAKWAGGFQDHGKVQKGHAVAAYPEPKGCSTGPFDGVDGSPRNSVTLCRKCLARRFGFQEDGDPPADPVDPATPDRFSHRDPV